MKCKKFLALVMTAVLSVSMLTAFYEAQRRQCMSGRRRK